MNERPQDKTTHLQPVWCVVAIVVAERPFGPGGAERRSGTKHFRPGAKLYIFDAFTGMCDSVVAIGHHRSSNRFCKLVVDIHHVERFRTQLAYSPTVLRLATEHFEGGVPHGPKPMHRRCVRSFGGGRNSESRLQQGCRPTRRCS